MITVIKTNKAMVKDFPVTKDTFIYTLDTRECFFDLNYSERMQLKTGIQYRDEDQIFAIPNPRKDKIYISRKTDKLYRRTDQRYVEIKERSQIVELLIGIKEMKPVVLTENGTNVAPRTLMSQVFAEDGRTLEQILEDRSKDKYTFIYTKTLVLEAEMDNQKIFDFPYPVPGYDIRKFPIEVIFGDNEYVYPINYSISKNQLIFGDVFAERILKGNLITLIFHYSETILHGDYINAQLINGRRVIYSENEPMEMKIGDIWYNLKDKLCLELTKDGWRDILNPEDIDVIISSIVVSATDMEIPINIEFDKEKDSLEVHRNGLLYLKGVDYDVSDDNRTIKLKEPNMFIIENEMHTFAFRVIKNGLPRIPEVTIIKD